ncbi:IclR family transcriptional regulator [Aestuariirhabdus sp. Z084]|uniref:IclR family transcriptional regulator n=1 Tax=Aestuariirhabdus haliotis TaxID=2918751 RepID=UPI0020BEED07|nr:IclR family transcriptional regulator [Aestuariirhabdus haliotis]MCL6416677.1 IclR family transcriptional regulator [Aestuariirhabdus haliotis]
MTSANKSPAAARVGQVQSLSRAFQLLMRLSEGELGFTLSELANQEQLPPSTVHRLLNSMRELGFAELDESKGLWSVGINAFRCGNAYLKKRDFITQARSVMKRLVAATGETSNLGVLQQGQVVFVGQVECSAMMRMAVPVGNSGPIHASGVGKALLSALPMKEALALLAEQGMPELTAQTLRNTEQFSDELRAIRLRGYAIDDQEQAEGLICIAANIYDEFGMALAAVSISGPTVRVQPSRLEAVGAQVVAAADEITDLIGGCRPEGQ